MNKSEFFKILKFGTVGGSGVVIDMGLTWFFKDPVGLNPYTAHIIGFLCAVCNNYILNKYWTFAERDKVSGSQFSYFLIVSFVGLLLSICSLFVLYNHINLSFYLSKFISIGIVSVWNYLINRYWVFNSQVKRVRITNL